MAAGGDDDTVPVATSSPSATQTPEPTESPSPTASPSPTSSPSLTPVATPSVMPNVTGMTLDTAQSDLSEYGVTPRVREVLSEEAYDATVLSQKPAAGQPFSSEVELTVSRRAQATYLADLQPVEGSPETDVVTMNGKEYSDSLILGHPTGWYEAEVLEYDIGRYYKTLNGAIGLSSRSQGTSVVRVQLLTETGKKLIDRNVKVGETIPLNNMDITNVLRLRFELTPVPVGEWQNSEVVLGDMKVLGLPEAVPQSNGFGDTEESTP